MTRPAKVRRPAPTPRLGATPQPGKERSLLPLVPARAMLAVALVALPALVVGLYVRAVHGPFIFDDYNELYYNPYIRSLWPLWKFFSSSPGLAAAARPLTHVSYAVNYAFGALEPFGYHAGNIAIHAANGLLVYGLALATLRLPQLADDYGRVAPLLALATALLFVAHPLQSEAVAYISGRSEVLAASFVLLTVWLYGLQATTRHGRLRTGCIVALPVTTAAALASKESAAVLPLALLVYDWCFLAHGDWRQTWPRCKIILLTVVPVGLGVPLLLARAGEGGPLETTAGFSFTRFGPGAYALTQFSVVLHYLRLTLLPVGLCADYDWPLAHSLWTPGVLIPLVIVATVIVLAFRAAGRWPLVTFAVFWMLVTLAPTSSIMPLADLVAERRMYLPLFGLALLATTATWRVVGRRHWAWSRGAPVLAHSGLLLAALAALCLLTVNRVGLWADPVALYRDSVAKAPRNPRAWLNLGATHVARGQLDVAWPELQEAERLYERKASVHAFERVGAHIQYNLGVVLYQRQQYAEAQAHFERARGLGPTYVGLRPMTDVYLGHLAVVARQWSVAAARYQEALPDLAPEVQRQVLSYLARAHIHLGRPDLARAEISAVLRDDPHNQEAASVLRELSREP